MTGFKGLPSINTLRVFEAAARLQSFKVAADELCLTPSAVSHQIKSLESQLGMQLFDRQGRRAILTTQGHEYARVIRSAFDEIMLGAYEVQRLGKIQPLRLRVARVFGENILQPWFDVFQEEFSDIRLDITWEDDLFTIVDDAFEDNRFDAAIVWGGGFWEGYDVYALMETEVTILGAGKIIKEKLPLDDLSLLCEYSWIINRQVPDAWEWWLSIMGCSDLKSTYQPIFVDGMEQTLQAVLNGEGLAVNDHQIYRPYIDQGLVKRVTDKTITGQAYYLIYPSAKAPNDLLDLFISWFVEKARLELVPARINIWPGMKGNVLEKEFQEDQ